MTRRAWVTAAALVLGIAVTLSAQREQFANNATSTLASGIAAGDLSLTVAAGTGALFPAISGGDFFFYATITEGSTLEIVKVTARSTDTFTIVRAQQGTSASAFTSAASIQQRITKSTLQGLRDLTSGWFNIAGPTAARTYTFPDASTTVLTTNAAVTIGQGGTGQTTATAAFDALSPVTTRGDVIVRNASNNVRLALGAVATSPWSDGTDLTYKAVSYIGGFVAPTFTTSSTSYVDVTGLTAALPANFIYAFSCYGTFSTNDNAAGTTNGIGFSLNGTGGTGQAAVYTLWFETTALNTSGNNTTSTTPFAIRNENTFNSMTATTSVIQVASLAWQMKGFYYTGTNGTSTFAVRVRSENGSPQSASIQVGSYCLFTKQG